MYAHPCYAPIKLHLAILPSPWSKRIPDGRAMGQNTTGHKAHLKQITKHYSFPPTQSYNRQMTITSLLLFSLETDSRQGHASQTLHAADNSVACLASCSCFPSLYKQHVAVHPLKLEDVPNKEAFFFPPRAMSDKQFSPKNDRQCQCRADARTNSAIGSCCQASRCHGHVSHVVLARVSS